MTWHAANMPSVTFSEEVRDGRVVLAARWMQPYGHEGGIERHRASIDNHEFLAETRLRICQDVAARIVLNEYTDRAALSYDVCAEVVRETPAIIAALGIDNSKPWPAPRVNQ